MRERRRTPVVRVGSVLLGGDRPVVVQAMTDTPTADVAATVAQCGELIEAGAEMVRVTVNDERAGRAVPRIVARLRDRGWDTPVIGDFHFNGHRLLTADPLMARTLDKYRINPGNLGRGARHDEHFAAILKVAVEHGKPVRIGVNHGSLDPELLTEMMEANARKDHPVSASQVVREAMVTSALRSAEVALRAGLRPDQIVLSVKMSELSEMVAVYRRLAGACEFALHLGLTEAGSGLQGTVASSAALAILLEEGIGDTIRVSLTPHPSVPRAREVETACAILQALGLRHFRPHVTSCPGCGRTGSRDFQVLAERVERHVAERMVDWRRRFPGVERLRIAVMGCVVNGPGESRHADIGISLPGASESPAAPVYADGRQIRLLKGERIAEEFLEILEDYIGRRFGGRS